MLEKLIRMKEAAPILGISVARLRQLVSRGEIPHIRPFGPGRSIMFSESMLKNQIRKMTVNTPADLRRLVANQ